MDSVTFPINIMIGSNKISNRFNTINNPSFFLIPNINPTTSIIGQTKIEASPVGLRLV